MVAASNVTSVVSMTSFFFIEDSFSVESVDVRGAGRQRIALPGQLNRGRRSCQSSLPLPSPFIAASRSIDNIPRFSYIGTLPEKEHFTGTRRPPG